MEFNVAFEKFKERIGKTIDNLKNEHLNIRAGRANPHILDKVTVEAYGGMSPLNQLGNISVPDARTLLISVWDISLLKSVEKAILAANLGLTPTNDGKVIRISFPEPTEERRKELCKNVKALAETAKISFRTARQDIMDTLKKLKKDNNITEDDQTIFEKQVEKEMNSSVELVDKLTKDKEAEVLKV
jgi:ribosome recycling factor